MFEPIHKVEIEEWIDYAEYKKMVNDGYMTVVQLCKRFGVDPKAIRVSIDGARVEFCTPWPLYKEKS